MLQIYRIPASSFWQCRYFVDGKYIRRNTGTEDKSVAITFAKQLFDSVRLAEKLDQIKHPHTFGVAARKFIQHQGTLVKVGDIDFRNQNEDQKKLDKDILPYFATLDVSAVTKQTINEYLGSLADRGRPARLYERERADAAEHVTAGDRQPAGCLPRWNGEVELPSAG